MLFFEHHREQLASRAVFVRRLVGAMTLAALLVAASLVLGMVGYHHFEGMSWTDAFANAAMILSGMGPLAALQTEAGKIFAGLYALYSGLAIVSITGITIAPIVHRFLHRLHAAEEDLAERVEEDDDRV